MHLHYLDILCRLKSKRLPSMTTYQWKTRQLKICSWKTIQSESIFRIYNALFRIHTEQIGSAFGQCEVTKVFEFRYISSAIDGKIILQRKIFILSIRNFSSRFIFHYFSKKYYWCIEYLSRSRKYSFHSDKHKD